MLKFLRKYIKHKHEIRVKQAKVSKLRQKIERIETLLKPLIEQKNKYLIKLTACRYVYNEKMSRKNNENFMKEHGIEINRIRLKYINSNMTTLRLLITQVDSEYKRYDKDIKILIKEQKQIIQEIDNIESDIFILTKEILTKNN